MIIEKIKKHDNHSSIVKYKYANDNKILEEAYYILKDNDTTKDLICQS